MKNIKIFITIFLLFILIQNVQAFEALKPISENATINEIISISENNQKFIGEYVKKHTKEQNLELLLAWKKMMTSVIYNPNNTASFNPNPNEDYLKNLQLQFSKTGIFPYYANNKYSFSIDYTKVYNIFGKYIPDDWSLYLKDLVVEQEGNFPNALVKNEKNLVMWEEFINKYPNFEKNWLVYSKIKAYENLYFKTGVFKDKNDQGAKIYKDEAVEAYDKFSQKYPNSKYGNISTRLSNLKKLKHSFDSPYEEEFNNISSQKEVYDKLQQDKMFVLENAKFVYDLTNSTWHEFNREYIRGNYIFILPDNENGYKIFDKNYKETYSNSIDEKYDFNDLIVKNGCLLALNKDKITLKNVKYLNDNMLSYKPLEKLELEKLFYGTNVIYISSLNKTDDNNYQINIKVKKYPKKFLIYNDIEQDFADYIFEDNSEITYVNKLEFEVKNKTEYKYQKKELKTEETQEQTDEIPPVFKFIFE